MGGITAGFAIAARGIAAAVGWVQRFMTALPSLGTVLMSVFVIYTAARLFLYPLIGQASSDTVRKFRKGSKESEE